jgi:hypothetical protein
MSEEDHYGEDEAQYYNDLDAQAQHEASMDAEARALAEQEDERVRAVMVSEELSERERDANRIRIRAKAFQMPQGKFGVQITHPPDERGLRYGTLIDGEEAQLLIGDLYAAIGDIEYNQRIQYQCMGPMMRCLLRMAGHWKQLSQGLAGWMDEEKAIKFARELEHECRAVVAHEMGISCLVCGSKDPECYEKNL